LRLARGRVPAHADGNADRPPGRGADVGSLDPTAGREEGRAHAEIPDRGVDGRSHGIARPDDAPGIICGSMSSGPPLSTSKGGASAAGACEREGRDPGSAWPGAPPVAPCHGTDHLGGAAVTDVAARLEELRERGLYRRLRPI